MENITLLEDTKIELPSKRERESSVLMQECAKICVKKCDFCLFCVHKIAGIYRKMPRALSQNLKIMGEQIMLSS